jgi:hypothetical protein
VFVTGSFIYWNPSQENMELGIVSDAGGQFVAIDGNVVNQDFDYGPGFQVGIGANLNRDNWDVFFQYTWFRNEDTTSTSLDPNGTTVLFPLRGQPDTQNITFFSGNEEWRLSMDLFDLELARSYYVGTVLTFRPFFGARSALIRQDLDVDYRNEATGIIQPENLFIDQESRSWAVGPRAGLNSSWMIGKGLRFFGNGSADILFTKYSHLSWHQNGTTAAGVTIPKGLSIVEQHGANYLRCHLDLELGFGWGMYFANNRSHVDLSAGYSFQVFFAQNMFREFTDDITYHSLTPNGDLYIHGARGTVRFDF